MLKNALYQVEMPDSSSHVFLWSQVRASRVGVLVSAIVLACQLGVV